MNASDYVQAVNFSYFIIDIIINPERKIYVNDCFSDN